MELSIKILSDNVSPNEQTVSVAPESKQLLVSKLTIPGSFSGPMLRIPAEVTSGGKLVARLDLLVKVAPSKTG